jgi:eukaryotic-like serine/threonine-protein kinase
VPAHQSWSELLQALASGPRVPIFDGPTYRYTFEAPLLDDAEDANPLAVAWRRPLMGDGEPQRVLLKHVVLPPERERLQRALEELWLHTRLRHAHILSVLDVEEYRGEAYVVLEHFPGLFLQTALELALLQGRRLSLPLCVYTAAAVADALDAAWTSQDAQGQPLRIVHRAVSPRAIRMQLDGGVKLTDFGVAHAALPERLETTSSWLRADLAQASPELMLRHGPLDGRADVYSLGMVLLELVSGVHPLDPPDVNPPAPESSDVLRHNARVRAERPSWESVGALAERIRRFGPEQVERAARHVPEALKRILHTALRPRPEERYPGAGAMRDALRGWLADSGQPFDARDVAREIRALLRDRPRPEDTRAFPAERGVLPTPEEAR